MRDSIQTKISEANALHLDSPQAGSSHLEQVIAVGDKLREIQAMGGGLQTFLEDRSRHGSRCFSASSVHQFMRLSRYASAIRAAKLTRVKEADHLALELECEAYGADISATVQAEQQSTALAAEHESRFFNDLRRLPAANQSAFLADLLARLIRFQQLFDAPAR